MFQIHRSQNEGGGSAQDPHKKTHEPTWPPTPVDIDPSTYDSSAGRVAKEAPTRSFRPAPLLETKPKDEPLIRNMIKGCVNYAVGFGITLAAFGFAVGLGGAVWGGVAWGASSLFKVGNPTTLGGIFAGIGATIAAIRCFAIMSERRDGNG